MRGVCDRFGEERFAISGRAPEEDAGCGAEADLGVDFGVEDWVYEVVAEGLDVRG